MNILPDLRGLIPQTRCRTCGGAYRTMGPGSVRVPHFPGCPRGPKNVEAPLAGTEAGEPQQGGHRGEVNTTAAVTGSSPVGSPAASTPRCQGCEDAPIGQHTGPHDWEQQDQERESLTEVESPFPIDYSRRTVFPGRSYWEPREYDIGTGWNE